MIRAGLVAVLLAAPLAPGAAQSVRGRLEGRVPVAVIAGVDSLVRQAAREQLPTEPLVQKALEGGAKEVPAARIVAAVETALAQLRSSRALLVGAGDAPPATAGEVIAVSAALRRGVPALVIERVVAALPAEPRGSALHAVADLVEHRFAPDSAADLILAASHLGLRGERLLDVSTAAVHELQRGRTRAAALADVQARLPDIPAAPKAGHETVVRARRP